MQHAGTMLTMVDKTSCSLVEDGTLELLHTLYGASIDAQKISSIAQWSDPLLHLRRATKNGVVVRGHVLCIGRKLVDYDHT